MLSLRGTPRERAVTLQSLSNLPVADPDLLAMCEELLEDRTIALLTLPYSFGEVRWCAADAVASLRRALGIETPVVLSDVFAPVSTAVVVRLAEVAGIEPKSGVDGMIETLEILAKLDRLPRRSINRTP